MLTTNISTQVSRVTDHLSNCLWASPLGCLADISFSIRIKLEHIIFPFIYLQPVTPHNVPSQQTVLLCDLMLRLETRSHVWFLASSPLPSSFSHPTSRKFLLLLGLETSANLSPSSSLLHSDFGPSLYQFSPPLAAITSSLPAFSLVPLQFLSHTV